MGIFHVTIEIGDSAGSRFVPVDGLVDTGASHTLVPRPILQQLGIVPQESWPFTLADESSVEYDVTEARVRIEGRTRTTIVVFGEPAATPLLGAYTLEGLRLAVHPVGQRLFTVPGLLKQMEVNPS